MSKTVVDRLYIRLWSRSVNSEAATLCWRAAAAAPGILALRMENCVVWRDVQWHSRGKVHLPKHSALNELFLGYPLTAGFFLIHFFYFSETKLPEI